MLTGLTFFFLVLFFLLANKLKSPYRIVVDGRTNTKQTKCYGPGLEKDTVMELVETYFTIETRDKNGKLLGKAGAGKPFAVKVEGPKGAVPAKIEDHGDGERKNVPKKKLLKFLKRNVPRLVHPKPQRTDHHQCHAWR